MLILTAHDIRETISMREAIDAVREGFIALSANRTDVPIRSSVSTPDGIMLNMPAYIEGAAVSVVKTVTVYPGNPARGLPTIIGSVLVLDATTGIPLALLDGTSLTALRTGAASGLATDLLARPETHKLGVIGTGVQARTQIEAVCTVRAIQEIRLYSLDSISANKLARDLRDQYEAEVVVANNAHEALADADVLVAATNSKTPVIHWSDISSGAHINGIGSFTPEMQEIAADVVINARIVVDHRESVWEEAGDLIIPRDQGLIDENRVHAEIGEIAAGSASGRADDQEVTFFKSVGNAVQDATVAARIIMTAMKSGTGTQVDFHDFA